jgi:hypothetical protein
MAGGVGRAAGRLPPTRTAGIPAIAYLRGVGSPSAQPLRELSADMGHPEPDHAARVLVMLHDGAFQSAELDDATAVRETLRRAVDEVFPAPPSAA